MDTFKSKLGFVLTISGCAIGIGTIWRFPYLAAKHGGFSFVFFYIIFLFLFGLPILIAEFSIGHKIRKNVMDIYKINNTKVIKYFSNIFSIMPLIAIFAAGSTYFVITGWSLRYLVESLFKVIEYNNTLGSAYYTNNLSSFLASPTHMGFYTLISIFLTSIIVYRGVSKGIERMSLIMMPMLFVTIFILLGRTFSLPNLEEGLRYLFIPNFSNINSSLILDALGQALFSLSVGTGAMITFANYFDKNANIIKPAFFTVFLTIIFVILMSLVIIPASFSFKVPVDAGTTLSFITLPNIFSSLSYGGFFAVIFFLAMFLAALTSTGSFFEVFIKVLGDKFEISRQTTTIIFSIIFSFTCSLSALSFNLLSDGKIFGLTIFDLLDHTITIFMCLASVGTSVFVGFLYKKEMESELNKFFKSFVTNCLMFLYRFIIPVIICVVFMVVM